MVGVDQTGAAEDEPMPYVGVIVRNGRVEEGLRMASALALCDNEVEVLVVADALPDNDEVALHLDSLDLEEIPVIAPFEDDRTEFATWEELSDKLKGYDHVLTF